MLLKPSSNLFKHFEAAVLSGRGFPRQSSGMFRPSEASAQISTKQGLITIGSCARQTWYRLKGVEPEKEQLVHQIQRMNVGKEVENSVIETCKRAGLFVDNAIQFRAEMGGVPIAGEMDVVLRTEPCGNIKYCMECKSIYGYHATKEAFGKYIGNGSEPGRPKDSYVMQTAIYLNHYSTLPEDDPSYLGFGAIFICDRGDGHFGVYDIWLEDEIRFLNEDEPIKVHRIFYSSDHLGVSATVLPYTVEDILSRFRVVMLKLDDSTPPPRDFVAEYNEEQVEDKYKQGIISDSAYKKWKTSHGPKGHKKEKLGDWQCSYCLYSKQCQLDN